MQRKNVRSAKIIKNIASFIAFSYQRTVVKRAGRSRFAPSQKVGHQRPLLLRIMHGCVSTSWATQRQVKNNTSIILTCKKRNTGSVLFFITFITTISNNNGPRIIRICLCICILSIYTYVYIFIGHRVIFVCLSVRCIGIFFIMLLQMGFLFIYLSRFVVMGVPDREFRYTLEKKRGG